MKRLLCSGLLAFFAAGLWGCKSEIPADSVKLTPSVSIGRAPEFDLKKVGGGSIRSSDLKGKVVIADFWATWCGPCISEIPHFNKLMEENAEKGVELIGITLESGGIDDVEKFAKEKDIRYPLVMGDDAVQESFKFSTLFPSTYVIGKDGKIFKQYVGALQGKKEKIEKDIAELLAK